MPKKRKAEIIDEGLLPPDHPIFREGFGVFLPLSSLLRELKGEEKVGTGDAEPEFPPKRAKRKPSQRKRP